MTPVVPNKTIATKADPIFQELSDLLLSGLEFLESAAGWIGLQDGGGLTFPVRIGVCSDSWFPWQQSHGVVWGFTINDETAVLNDLNIGSKLGDPPLCNVLSVPLIHDKQVLGHVALANKGRSFTNEDALALQALAHHMVRLLGRRAALKPKPRELPAAWRLLLDRSAEGILLLEESGLLIYANAAWLNWTGFCAEELLGRTAPFSFWVSQHHLLQALSQAPAVPAGALPFLRRDQSLFWCEVETTVEQWDDRLLTIAFLRQAAPLPQRAGSVSDGTTGGTPVPPLSIADASGSLDALAVKRDWLPLLLDLDHGIEGWGSRWEDRTGLLVRDVEGSRCELVLDWLFPQQHDRNHVADCFHNPCPTGHQLVLEVAVSNGSRPMLCTLLPLPIRTATALPRRWLLLVSEVERAAETDIVDGPIRGEIAATDKTPRTGIVSNGGHAVGEYEPEA